MITFEGRYITLGDLKRRVKTRKKLRVSDLLVFNAQTNEEYTDDGAIIPNNTATGDSSISLEQLLVSDNLIEANASEDDKIKAVMFQSSRCFYPVDYARQLIGLLPLNYICFRCGIPGHLIKYCPNIGAPKFDGSKQPKKCSGIPRSFMVKVDDPNREGVMRTNDGQFVIPIINV
ncbi:E3 ubiquitin-protein ligase RBBP6-like [Myxocyprinus asiaticus]|uniref:E3 ubiquitin-protein ligase RBBP6-like n=1 Tax=Myxocyprinus asiaticus TaxID=70543 RepID=UPI002221CFA8|nr:E3 ubiquitin-protein ligase RBBP6-like [Myxocyprinus asiaticus]